MRIKKLIFLLIIFLGCEIKPKQAGTMQLWTHENHAVKLSTNEMIDSRLEYIHENPVCAGWVKKSEDYMYSSARNYSGLPGIIEVDLI